MTQWLQAARAAMPLPTKPTKPDKTIPGRAWPSPLSTGSGVSSVLSVLSEGVVTSNPQVDPVPPLAPDDDFSHGRCAASGDPRTWTGRIVSIEEWRRLSEWDRHGSTGKFWNGITKKWELRGALT